MYGSRIGLVARYTRPVVALLVAARRGCGNIELRASNLAM